MADASRVRYVYVILLDFSLRNLGGNCYSADRYGPRIRLDCHLLGQLHALMGQNASPV